MKKNEPLISVVIPTFNHEEYIEEAIQSVLEQTYKNYEIIVVDDGSKDNTRNIIRKFENNIKYIHQKNQGPSFARNRGLKKASGGLIAFLDADDVWMKEKLDLQYDMIQQDMSIGIVGCSAYDIDKNGNIIDQWSSKDFQSHIDFLEELSIRNEFYGGTSGALIKKECFEKVGLFNEYLHFGEDWDMWLRITKIYNVRFAKEFLVKIRKHDSPKGYKNIELVKNNIFYIIENNIHKDCKKTKNKAFSVYYSNIANFYLQEKKALKSLYYSFKAILFFPKKIFPEDRKFVILTYSFIPHSILIKLKFCKSQFKIGRKFTKEKSNR